MCTQAALIPIVYTDESWGPKVFSFTVCKGPKESHAVEIKYINSAAVIGNGGKKERGVSKPHEIGRASFWPQVIVRVIKQTQTRKTSITPIPHQNERFGITPRHWDVQKKSSSFKQGGVLIPLSRVMSCDPCFFSAIFLGVIELVRGPTWCFALLQLPSFCS